jgi:peptide/nickel transport system substrate-binding protein
MAEAGHASGFDAGLYYVYVDGSYANVAEIAINNLAAVGIRLKLQPVERAAFFAGIFGQEVSRWGHPIR